MTQAFPLQWPAGWPRTPRHMLTESRNRWGKHEKGKAKRPWSFAEARDELLLELERTGAADAVLSTNFRLTQYGLPSKNLGRPDDEGVAVYFTLNGTQMVMAQDGHTRAEENMRALALVLRYLRGVENLGGGTMMERAFTGFTALPPPMQPQRPWRQVFRWPDEALPTRDGIQKVYRALAAEAHPDRGGNAGAMAEINAARDEALREIA